MIGNKLFKIFIEDKFYQDVYINPHSSFGDIRITVSQGVAVMDQSMYDLNDLVQAADRALYRAKETGRNKVVTSTILK